MSRQQAERHAIETDLKELGDLEDDLPETDTPWLDDDGQPVYTTES